MIKVDKGNVEYSGMRIWLKAELGCIMHNFLEDGVLTKEDLDECVKLSTMSKEEVDAENDKLLKASLKEFFDGLFD